MQISEPVTMLTDYLLGGAGFYLGALLIRITGPKNRISARLWSIGFIISGIAALVGGTYHGFAVQLGDSLRGSLWNVTIYSIGASAGFMISGVLASSIPRDDESARWLVTGVILTLVGFAIQQSSIRLLANFNHNDIYHVVQIGALCLLFRGARLLRDP